MIVQIQYGIIIIFLADGYQLRLLYQKYYQGRTMRNIAFAVHVS